jgi:hypothetical protein
VENIFQNKPALAAKQQTANQTTYRTHNLLQEDQLQTESVAADFPAM